MKTFFVILILGITSIMHSQALLMKITNPQVNGNQVVFDVRADNFTDMVGMQYSIIYDPAMLTYVSTQNFNLPDLSLSDFNSPTPGVLLNVWLKLSQGGVTNKNGTLLYQIVFEIINNNYGTVCFSENPLANEFVIEDALLASFDIMDGCHSEPFQIDLITSTEELGNRYGMYVQNIANSHKITFSLNDEQALAFGVFDILGKQLNSIPKMIYTAGSHTIDMGSSIVPGIYILTTEIQHQHVALKILSQ